ncbi:hypothetical protein ACQ86N_11460 [Puia sp. P3]|uniref:hypothetical protein n=1 Tax=Puia sp. P3 TaxID=3423952 RepID=UPI003D675B62
MLIVLLIGGAIVYYEIQWKISRVEVARHERLNDIIAQQIKEGGDYTGHPTRRRATITRIPADSMPRGISSYYTRGVGWNPEFQGREYRLVVTSFYTIGSVHYRVSTYSFIPSFYQAAARRCRFIQMDTLIVAGAGSHFGWANLEIYSCALQTDPAGHSVL